LRRAYVQEELLNICREFADAASRGFKEVLESGAARPYGEDRPLAALQWVANTDSYGEIPTYQN
jgi:hypothetical protein